MGVLEKIVEEMHGPYSDDLDASPEESFKIEMVMVAGMEMKDAAGLVCPFRIPPAVALAIVRTLS